MPTDLTPALPWAAPVLDSRADDSVPTRSASDESPVLSLQHVGLSLSARIEVGLFHRQKSPSSGLGTRCLPRKPAFIGGLDPLVHSARRCDGT